MPEIDKNYLAGLYLDEITLDVMPQEYIDAALDVKLRYDACAPRAGYVCVQDRRVKGGFYYRKAPQGQGVNALPPSKLERALARSQEESRPRSEMGFLGKAAIGAGLAVGGLALTGAVINAGRSSKPYQEPVRQRPTPPSSNTTRNVAVSVGTAATVGLGVGAAIANKPVPPANTDIKEVEPIVEKAEASTPTTKPQSSEPRNPEAEAAYKSEQVRIQALKELTEAGYLPQKRGYELALAADLKKKQLLPEDIEKKKKELNFTDDEGYVRIDDVKVRAGNGVINKAAREKQSADLQRLYDKFKQYGLEDSIQFRGAVGKKDGVPLKESANQYSIDLGDGKGPIRVAEMRFTLTQDKIQDAIAEKIKNPQAQSQPPEKSAKPTTSETPAPVSAPPAEIKDQKSLKEEAQGALGVAIRRSATTPDGYVNQSSLLNNKVLKSRLAGNDPATLIAEGVDAGHIQVKAVGKNTYIRDIRAIPLKDFVAEAKGLSDVKDLQTDRRVKDLQEALAYRESKASESEKAGIAELRAAIAGIQPRSQTKPSDNPNSEEGTGGVNGGKKRRGESQKMKNAAAKPGSNTSLDMPSTPAQRSQAEIEADRLAEEQAKKVKEREAKKSKAEGLAGTGGTRITEKAVDLTARKELKQISDEEYNAEVEKLRKSPVVVSAVKEAIAPIAEKYQDLVDRASTMGEAKKLQEEGQTLMMEEARNIYDRFQIPDLVEVKPTTRKQAPSPQPGLIATDTDGQDAARSQVESSKTASKSEKLIEEFDKKKKAEKKRQKAQETYIEKLDRVVAGEWVKDPNSTDRYNSNARKTASDKDANLSISIDKEDDGWIVYTEEHNPEDLAEMFSGRNRGKTRFFSLEQAKEAANEFADYYESLVQENKAQHPEYHQADFPSTPTENLPTSTKRRSRSSKSANTATSTEKEKNKGLSVQVQQRLTKYENSISLFQKQLEGMKKGESPDISAMETALDLAKINKAVFKNLPLEQQVSKIEKAIVFQQERVKQARGTVESFGGEDNLKITVAEIKRVLSEKGISIPKGVTKKEDLFRLLPKSSNDEPKTNNDAIAPSEAYLSAYWEIRNKYRRAS